MANDQHLKVLIPPNSLRLHTPAYQLPMSDHETFDVASLIFSGVGSTTSFHKPREINLKPATFRLASTFEPQLYRRSRSTRQYSPPKIAAPWRSGDSKYPCASLFYRMVQDIALRDPSSHVFPHPSDTRQTALAQYASQRLSRIDCNHCHPSKTVVVLRRKKTPNPTRTCCGCC